MFVEMRLSSRVSFAVAALTVLIVRTLLVTGTSLRSGSLRGWLGRGEKKGVVGDRPGILPHPLQPGGQWEAPQRGALVCRKWWQHHPHAVAVGDEAGLRGVLGLSLHPLQFFLFSEMFLGRAPSAASDSSRGDQGPRETSAGICSLFLSPLRSSLLLPPSPHVPSPLQRPLLPQPSHPISPPLPCRIPRANTICFLRIQRG